MRLRKKPGTMAKILLEKEYFISDPELHRGCWQKVFPLEQPLILEIGMGGGQLLAALAAQKPDFNYIGLEKYEELLVYAIQKAKAQSVNNLKVLWFNAEKLEEIFADNEISEIHLNFSDPWPKARHAKRRLTSELFLAKYRQLLKPSGILKFKTDNQQLFEFSLEQLQECGWIVERTTSDLHSEDYFDGLMTEYEARFHSLGTKIYSIQARNLIAET